MTRAPEGWTVVVTRAEGHGGALGTALEEAGAEVLLLPTVEVGLPSDLRALDDALGGIASYDWVVFTSPRAVEALASRGVELPGHLKIAAVGPSTGAAVTEAGWRASHTGSGDGAEALARELVAQGVGHGSAVLFPASSRARRDLERILRAAGASVDRVTAYETRPVPFDAARHSELGRVDVVTFTSPSAVEGWLSAMGDEAARFLAPGVRYVVIGATTEAAAREGGLEATVAEEPSFQGVVAATVGLAGGAADG